MPGRGSTILKRLAGKRTDEKTVIRERRMPHGSDEKTVISRKPRMQREQRNPPERGRHRQYRSYTSAEKVEREVKPKRLDLEHEHKVEEHKRKHRPGGGRY